MSKKIQKFDNAMQHSTQNFRMLFVVKGISDATMKPWEIFFSMRGQIKFRHNTKDDRHRSHKLRLNSL